MKIVQRGPRTWRLFWELGRDAQGRRRQRTETFHGSRREAERRWREVQAEIDAEGRIIPEEMTVADLAERWLSEAATRLRPATADNDRRVVRRCVLPRLGAKRVQELRPTDIEDAMRDALKAVSPRTVALMRAVLRQCLDRAVEMGIST